MAKGKKQNKPDTMANVEQTLSKTEQFLEDNYRSLIYGLVVVAVVVGLVWLIKNRIESKTEEALSQMYVAEDYFAIDSLNLALYGDGNYLGFIDIASEYKSTKAGNLANYYAGVCYLRLGEFEDAIDFLDNFKRRDRAVSPIAIGCTGDAYVELGDIDKGIEYYMKAASFSYNTFYNPLYLFKAGQLHELEGRKDEALKLYEKIRDEYPDSSEGRNIEKNIARLNIAE